MAQLINREAAPLLDEIRDILGLSESEIADLFGVRRPSLTAWRSVGIPQGRRATAERLRGLARVFDRELIHSRIPEIVRTPDAWLGNRTILDVLIAEGPDPVYGYLSRLFAYAEGA
ncbi:MAG: hypothetical protein ACRENL_09955 [Candidatus Dormibacteria bacterium]